MEVYQESFFEGATWSDKLEGKAAYQGKSSTEGI
jgi:hypothetical protein